LTFRRYAIVLVFLLAACATGDQSEKDNKQITPISFYNSFNMRSFSGSFGNNLRYYCESYPKDFFQISIIEENFLEISYEEIIVWRINFKSHNTINIYDAVYSGSYRDHSIFDVIFDEDNQDWRRPGFYAPPEPDCIKNVSVRSYPDER
jgi:hypothetical protein